MALLLSVPNGQLRLMCASSGRSGQTCLNLSNYHGNLKTRNAPISPIRDKVGFSQRPRIECQILKTHGSSVCTCYEKEGATTTKSFYSYLVFSIPPYCNGRPYHHSRYPIIASKASTGHIVICIACIPLYKPNRILLQRLTKEGVSPRY